MCIYQKIGKNVLEILGPGHDGNGRELGVGIVMVSAGRELFFSLVVVFWI